MLLQKKNGPGPILKLNAPAHFSHAIRSLTNRTVREHVDAVAFTYLGIVQIAKSIPYDFPPCQGQALIGQQSQNLWTP
jgi:hypothetical protein